MIVVTADDRPETAEAAFLEGANDLVTKPVDAVDLIARVQEAIGLAAALSAVRRRAAAAARAAIAITATV